MENQHTPENDLSSAGGRQRSVPRRDDREQGIYPRLAGLLTGVLLFVGTAAFVLWQDSHLTVLWDLSYILENATRIALGQIPYRDFPFPYAPLTFVMQAAIIKLTGRVVLHHYIYAAVSAACATLLTWRILLRLLMDSAMPSRLTAFLLTLPLVFLGTESIFPHPFYDADCTLAILFCVWLMLRVETDRPDSRTSAGASTFICGMLLVVPAFVKQNTGLVFLLAAVACIAWLMLRDAINRMQAHESVAKIGQPRAHVSHAPGTNLRAGALLLAGAAAGMAIALALIQRICGLANYYHWTIQFAAARRLPGLSTMLGVYRDPALLWSCVVFAAGRWIFRLGARQNGKRFAPTGNAALPAAGALAGNAALPAAGALAGNAALPAAGALAGNAALPAAGAGARWLAVALLSLPFLWTMAALWVWSDDSDRAEALLHLWPVLLAASLVFALWRLPRASTLAELTPLILLAAIHGAFLSQQLWGSTYALWPLPMILIASILIALAPRSAPHATLLAMQNPSAAPCTASLPSHSPTGGGCRPPGSLAPLVAFAGVVSLSLLIAGGHYALSHERLSYADLSGEALEHSALPPLRGLAMRGDWLPDFEELVAYTGREIPPTDAILTIPGEDLFYFTTGRTPRFPVLMLDNTVNPYSAPEIARLARERHVAWVVVKRRLQLQEEPLAFRPQLMELLARDYEPVESLNNYDIYRRKQE